MKNVTLSIPDELLARARKYASEHGTTLNKMIRELLRQRVQTDSSSLTDFLNETQEQYGYRTGDYTFDRDELHER